MKKKKSALRSAPKRCVMGANESEICKTADELSKLFNPADVDAPDALLVKILQDHVKRAIAPYKYPRRVVFTDALPKTQTGKIQRFRLRD